jgi:hypothetical protein
VLRVALCVALTGAAIAAAQPRTGAQMAAFRSTVDDSDQPYALYVPRSFDAARKYALLVTLHSEDVSERIALRRALGVMGRTGLLNPEDLRNFPPVSESGFIVAAPLARGSMGYEGIPERDVYDMLADVERRFPIDPDRVYLTGTSMGGTGALRLALTRPDVWAAVAPVCPGPLPGLEELAPNALNLPVRLFHGEQDPISPPEISRTWQRTFLSLGVSAEYIEYPGVRHNVWDLAYRDGAMFNWFSKIRRPTHPERVRLVTRSYRYGAAYWVHIDGLTPGELASVDASWSGSNALGVESRNVDGFTVAPPTVPKGLVKVTIDGTALHARPAASLSFRRVAGRWQIGRFRPTGKRRGAEGPISEAASGRQIYVYGTVGANADELEARKKLAEKAAAWTSPWTRLLLSFPVKADTAIADADLDSADLILFGTAATNSLIARFSPSLPLALNPGAADYGLLFVAPAGKHYVLVSSGLPWWSGAEEANREGAPDAPLQFRLLSSFGDYILFKGSLAHVVAEGRFDRNWKVPADAAVKMTATGTVTVSK